jgi:glucose/mannose transport system permease protein
MMTARRRIQWGVHVGLFPATVIAGLVYLGTMIWTIGLSFTESRMLPVARFAGLDQYWRLFGTTRWQVSLNNIAIFGVLMILASLAIGLLLAIALDRRVRGEGVFRTILLYPYAISFVVTGFIWQWILNPSLGIQRLVRGWGFADFRFDWIVENETAIYCVVLAAVWHAAGLVMAIMLAGLRGVDQDLWRAARVDGVKPWQVYLHVILPILRPNIITAVVLLSLGVVKLYDLVVALTGGGPGISSEVPAKFVMDNLFIRQNIGLAAAGATVLLVTVLSVLAPWLYYVYFRAEARRAA